MWVNFSELYTRSILVHYSDLKVKFLCGFHLTGPVAFALAMPTTSDIDSFYKPFFGIGNAQ